MAHKRKIFRNIKLTISYCGTHYHGWQKQPDVKTVQEVLERAIATITSEEPSIIASGRTDAGVHALGQVVNFRTESQIPLDGLVKGLNSLLPQDIAVLEAKDVPWKFHAIGSAVSKTYQYLIINSRTRLPFWEDRAWVYTRSELDIEAMNEAARVIEGTHDFSSFTASGSSAKTRVRTVSLCNVAHARTPLFPPSNGNNIMFTIAADGFLRYMVRNITGLLVEIGTGRRDVHDVRAILEARDRAEAAITAPPQGLYLMRVEYDPEAERLKHPFSPYIS